MDAAALEDWMIRRLAETLGRSPGDLDPDVPFASLGLDSAGAVALTGDLEDELGVSIDPTLVFEFPTIARLAAHLAARPTEPR